MKVGTGRATLALPEGLGLFGFGPAGGRGYEAVPSAPEYDRLQVRALWLEHGPRRLLSVTFDLTAGSRVVEAALRARLAAHGVALEAGELCVQGTHTHAGPGGHLGNFYDQVGVWPLGFRPELVRELVARGAEAALEAHAQRVDCLVAHGTPRLWGVGRNRSLAAFLRNFDDDPTGWTTALGEAPPPDLTPEEQAVDPRLTVLTFVERATRRVKASWASFCCHPATTPRAARRAYHRDWVGVAVDTMESEIPFAVVHQRANGDVTPLRSGALRQDDPLGRIREVGGAVASAWREAVRAAPDLAEDADLDVGFRRFVPRAAGLPGWDIGTPVIWGSEEFEPGFLVDALGEGKTAWLALGPEKPKTLLLWPFEQLGRLFGLGPSPEHPLWLVRVGRHVRFMGPFEQTTFAAFTLEQELGRGAAAQGLTFSPIGLAGDYAGYLTTPREYQAQHYEGAHTLYGPSQLSALSAAYQAMWSGPELLRDDAPAVDEADLAALLRRL